MNETFYTALINKISISLNNNYSSFVDDNFFSHPYKPKEQIQPENWKDKIIQYISHKNYAPKHSIEMTLKNILKTEMNHFQFCCIFSSKLVKYQSSTIKVRSLRPLPCHPFL